MNRKSSFRSFAVAATATVGLVFATRAAANPSLRGQVCTVASAGIGQAGTLMCRDIASGATTQTLAIGTTVAASGGTGGTFSRRDQRVLVANRGGGALLLHERDGRLESPTVLSTGSEGALSGALSERGAYVLTGTKLYFFATGHDHATSSRTLLVGDGSAAQVALAGGHAYVSEKSASLEAFVLAGDGSLGPATAVSGVPAGVIVGIAGHDDLVVAPVAHLASNANQSTIPIVAGTQLAQLVPTKEVAACWTTADADEVCVSNPGSMTLSCGHIGDGGFTSYTSAAASVPGDSLFDLDRRDGVVGVLGKQAGAPLLLTFVRTEPDSDFLSLVAQSPIASADATGALLLPPLSR